MLVLLLLSAPIFTTVYPPLKLVRLRQKKLEKNDDEKNKALKSTTTIN